MATFAEEIKRAIADPAWIVGRRNDESVTDWQTRAVLYLVEQMDPRDEEAGPSYLAEDYDELDMDGVRR